MHDYIIEYILSIFVYRYNQYSVVKVTLKQVPILLKIYNLDFQKKLYIIIVRNF